MIWICYIAMIAVPYLLSGINTSIIVAKVKTGKDIREMGSGNAGLTNTLRVLGKGAAGVVLLGDVSKAAIAVLIVRLIFLFVGGVNTMDRASDMTWVENVAVFMSIVGHCYPVYYKFKGGKGVLASISAIFVYDWRIACILLSIFIIIVSFTRYVSLGSCIASSCYFIVSFCYGMFIDGDPAFIINTIISAFCGGLIVFRHRENIKRLLSHTEKKLGEKAK
ncbi:MAG: glycerol-3-phosphate 1-O-acyltransferase PlsY [Oscillospiraceae bacterium]|nr:glycerol-3-phosphate 1-O-acyltransferase PlsY [Oscillospiraceae bacterium]MCH5208675.1 glycerol-3-phosphate 1-O-acyltransferase PlsY [Oscillospiraceae bacterium]